MDNQWTLLSILADEHSPAQNHRRALQTLRNWWSLDDVIRSLPDAALEDQADQILCRLLLRNPSDLVLECLNLLWTNASSKSRHASLRQCMTTVPVLLGLWDEHRARILDLLRLWTRLKDKNVQRYLLQESGLVERIRGSLDHTAPLLKDLSLRGNLYDEFVEVVLVRCNEKELQESLSAVLWNWSIKKSASMSRRADVWDVLKSLLQSDSSVVLANGTAALGTLLVSQGEEPAEIILEQEWMVPRLLEIVSDETDAVVRRRCMRTARRLSGTAWGRKLLGDPSSSLLKVLANPKDETDTRIHVCQTLSALEVSTPYLETTLVQVVEDESSDSKLVLAATRTLYRSLKHSPWKRGSSNFGKAFFLRMKDVLSTESAEVEYHLVFAELLSELVNHAVSDVTTLIRPELLDVLGLLLAPVGPDFERPQQQTIEMCRIFVELDTKMLAQNEGLLTALVNFCLLNSGTAKDEAKKLILKLVPEL